MEPPAKGQRRLASEFPKLLTSSYSSELAAFTDPTAEAFAIFPSTHGWTQVSQIHG